MGGLYEGMMTVETASSLILNEPLLKHEWSMKLEKNDGSGYDV